MLTRDDVYGAGCEIGRILQKRFITKRDKKRIAEILEQLEFCAIDASSPSGKAELLYSVLSELNGEYYLRIELLKFQNRCRKNEFRP